MFLDVFRYVGPDLFVDIVATINTINETQLLRK